MTEEDRVKAHMGDAVGEELYERACIIHADRVPWERALDQAEALVKGRTSSSAPGRSSLPQTTPE